MIGKNRVPVLQDVECLDGMPVVKMEVIKFLVSIEPLEVFHHSPAHAVAILYDVISKGLAVMIKNIINRLVRYLATGKVVNFVVLCQGLSEMGCSTGKSAHTLCVE
jgi:hypothetical protein